MMKKIDIRQENGKICYIFLDKIISIEETDNGKTWINTDAVDRGGITRAYIADESLASFISRMEEASA